MSPAAVSVPRPLPARRAPPSSHHRWIHWRDLLAALIARDITLRYRGSWLGLAWTLLNPLTELAVLLFIFKTVLPLNIPNYGAFLFIGLLVYSWFQSALTLATGAIVNNRELIRRPGMPSAILPIVTVASTLAHFLFALPVLFVLLLWSGIRPTSAMFALPLLVGAQFVLILGLAYPVAAIHVWFRDTQYLLRIALQLLFYLTPVFYEASAIPERFGTIYRFNPMVAIVEAYRDVLMRGRLPDAGSLLRVTAIFTCVLVLGLVVFRRTSHRFADEL